MAWDYSQRRASRWCLFPLGTIGPEFGAPTDGQDPFADPDLDDGYGSDDEGFDGWGRWNDDGQRATCGAGDTDADGLCPLHTGLPYRNMTGPAWEHVKAAITARRVAGQQAQAAWGQVRSAKTATRDAKVDKWNALVEKINAGQAITWRTVSVADKKRLAADPNLPEWVGLGLLEVCAPACAEDVEEVWEGAVAFGTTGPFSQEQRRVDPRHDVRAEVARNPNRSPAVVAELVRDPNPVVRVEAVRGQALPPGRDLLVDLVNDPATCMDVLRNRTIDPDFLSWAAAEIVGNTGPLVARLAERRFAAGMVFSAYPHTRQPVRERCAEVLAQNWAAPADLLDLLARSGLLGYPALARMAAHPNLGADTRAFLAQSKWKTVRDAAAR